MTTSRSELDTRDGATPVRPSVVTLPERRPDGVATVLDFVVARFPRIPEAVWRQRFADGKVWSDGGAVAADEAYRPLLRLRYRREVEREPAVRTDFRIVWEDEDLVVVDKPPHLPVTPGGRWVRGCLLHLLEQRPGGAELAPLHRLDRLTSGLVVLSARRATRSHDARLFATPGLVQKAYTAVCEVRVVDPPRTAVLEHHIVRSETEYWRQEAVPGRAPNARCEVLILDRAGELALVRVRPRTGRKHQIRLQLAEAGLPILGDPIYGTRPFHDAGDRSFRMWLDAHLLRVANLPRPAGGGPLSATWTSARDPAELLRRAVDGQVGGSSAPGCAVACGSRCDGDQPGPSGSPARNP